MPGAANRPRIDVACMGYAAGRALGISGNGSVGAVFERSFYLKVADAWLCVLGPSAAMGPLVVRCDLPEDMDWSAGGIEVGMPVSVGNSRVLVGSRFLFSHADASTWTPPPPPEWTGASLRRGIGFLIRWMEGNRAPDDGLGELVLPHPDAGPRSAVAARAAEPADALGAWLAAVLAGSPEAPPGGIDGLIGLGPGLTPSGDDFLGGAMIGLHLVGRPDLAARLWAAVQTKVAALSTAISRAHLAAAGEGAAAAGLHEALNGILATDGGSLPSALARVGQIGHTSGWDALAGAVTVFGQVLETAGGEGISFSPAPVRGYDFHEP